MSSSGNGAENSNENWVIDLNLRIWYGGDEPANGKVNGPSISKVPHRMIETQNEQLPQWYKPSVISIGPYHYDSFPEIQKRKHIYAQKFMEETQQDRNKLYWRIRKRTEALRNCYDEDALKHWPLDNDLATVFLLDGCFVLHFINHSRNNEPYALHFTNHEMNRIMQDLFLLENQLPYEVLEILFQKAGNLNHMSEKIRDFVTSYLPFPSEVQAVTREITNLKPSHLLHYLHHVILGKSEKEAAPNYQREQTERKKLIWRYPLCNNVQELRKVGIRFMPSPTCLTDISFSRGFGATGCLKLPIISMNHSTMILFLNLIAFESSSYMTNNLGVISYLCFLDSLIDHWDDVMELQTAGIIRNFAGDRREVPDFFNNVCNKLVPDPSAYIDVMQQIDDHKTRHRQSRFRQWYIQCKHKYFSSPWTCMALFAAILGLLLTAIQAYTSVFSNH